MTQPLSYQMTQSSCWTTSVLNGILYLMEDIDNIPTLTSHILHTVLVNEGTYYPYSEYPEFYNGIFRCIEEFTNKKIKFSKIEKGNRAKKILEELRFGKKQVAVFDIHKGEHSILIFDKKITGILHSILIGKTYMIRKKSTSHTRHDQRRIHAT